MGTLQRNRALLVCTLFVSTLLLVLATRSLSAGAAKKRFLLGAEVLIYGSHTTEETTEVSFRLGGNYSADALTDATLEERARVAVQRALSAYPDSLVRTHLRRIVFTDRLMLRFGSERAEVGAYPDPTTRLLVVNARSADMERAARHGLGHLLMETHPREWARFRTRFIQVSGAYTGPDSRTFLFQHVSLNHSQDELYQRGYTEEYSASGADEDAAGYIARIAAGDSRFWEVFDAPYRYSKMRRKAEIALRFLKSISGNAVTESRFRALCACPPDRPRQTTTITTVVVTSAQPTAEERRLRRGQLNTWFLDAVAAGDSERVRRLLRNGADANAQTRSGVTALHLAAHWDDDAELLGILLDAGADVNRRDRRGRTPLLELTTIENASATAARLLLKHGADRNAKDREGWSALFYAVTSGSPEIVRLLIRSGADTRYHLPDGRSLVTVFAETEQAGPEWGKIGKYLRDAGLAV